MKRILLALPVEFYERLEAFRSAQHVRPSLSETLRTLLEAGLAVAQGRP